MASSPYHPCPNQACAQSVHIRWKECKFCGTKLHVAKPPNVVAIDEGAPRAATGIVIDKKSRGGPRPGANVGFAAAQQRKAAERKLKPAGDHTPSRETETVSGATSGEGTEAIATAGAQAEAQGTGTDSPPQHGADSQAQAAAETMPPATGSDQAQTDAAVAAVMATVGGAGAVRRPRDESYICLQAITTVIRGFTATFPKDHVLSDYAMIQELLAQGQPICPVSEMNEMACCPNCRFTFRLHGQPPAQAA